LMAINILLLRPGPIFFHLEFWNNGRNDEHTALALVCIGLALGDASAMEPLEIEIKKSTHQGETLSSRYPKRFYRGDPVRLVGCDFQPVV
jgi:hypothetical protein